MAKLRSGSIFLGICLSTTLGLTACTQPPINPTSSHGKEPVQSNTAAAATTSPLHGVTLSNLVDEESKNEVRTALLTAGVPAPSADRFFAQVDLYNDTVAKNSLLPSGFRPYPADYSLVAMSDLWNKRFREFIGTNCRINTFLLTEDLVTLDPQQSDADNSMLFLDEDAIANSPTPLLSEREQGAFKQVFGRIETTSNHDPKQHVADIEQYFRDRNVTFQNPDVKIVSVFIHDTLDTPAQLFIGHVGVAVPHEDGIMFVEKLAFDQPYQALKFRDYAQLNTYLRALYDDGPDLEYAQPVIFSNDEVLSTP